MNWLDIVLLVFIIWSLLSSFAKGFSREFIGLIAVVAGFLFGMRFYEVAGAYLRPYVSSNGVANFCGFLVIFFGFLLLGVLISSFVARFVRVTGLSWFDRLLGGAFGFLRGVLVSSALVMALLAFAPGLTGNSPPRSVVESRLAPYVMQTARICSEIATPELKEGFRRRYEQVKGIWSKVGHAFDLPRLPRPFQSGQAEGMAQDQR